MIINFKILSQRLTLLIALLISLLQLPASLQQQQQTSIQQAVPAIEQQQQQQATNKPLDFASNSAGVTNGAASQKQAQPKSNHRLVDKIKDARQRRRHRHHRNRNYHQQQLAEKQAAAVAAAGIIDTNLPQQQQQQQQQTTALTALESIVEEVARVGQQQLPAGAQFNQQQQQPLPSTVSAVALAGQQTPPQPQAVSHAPTPTEMLLDGSAPPFTQLHPNGITNPTSQPQQQQQQQVITQTTSQQAIQPTILSRPHTNNSRGFFLTSMLSKIMNVLNVTEFALEMRDGISSRASCMACNAVVGLFLSPLYSKEVFSAAIRTVCTSFKIQPARVCAGLVESFQDDFEYIRKNTKLTRDEVCAVVFGVDCARRQTYNLFWTVPIPEMPNNGATKPSGSHIEPLNPAGLPINAGELSNMEDAPDLFEYRKSSINNNNGAALENKQQVSVPTSSSSSSPISPSSLQMGGGKDGLNLNQENQSINNNNNNNNKENLKQTASNNNENKQMISVKEAKMLKRPEYIFDDEHYESNNQQGSDRQLQEQQNKVSTFVHITDIHIDPYYEPGSLNDCNEPLCCRATSGPVAIGDKRRQAGRWGDYGNCDTPVRTLVSALNRIREQHSNAEYWLWTGDISPHDIWNISKIEAGKHVRLVTKLVREYSNGIPVFPVIGNHEAHPVNSFSPPEIKGKFSMSWLYDLLADEWSEWLPKDAQKTLRIGGFYKLQVRKGFRIIALNTNYCARLNPWSFYDPIDPANQLKWLADQLLEAELNQDKVHIIGHVPPDNRECTQAWLFNFINIVDRFRDTIVAQFYGHTHRDEWRIMYSMKKPDEVIGIQFIGPSITPFTENNPAYRIYHQNRQGLLLDSETYFFNLTEANDQSNNLLNEPNWQFSYSARQHLNMTTNLLANEWHNYLEKLQNDDELFDSFYKNYYRSSDVKTNQICKAKCKYQMLSDLRLTHPYKTKPKPFLANRKTSNHHHRHDRHNDRHDHHHHYHHHYHHHHHHHKRLRNQ